MVETELYDEGTRLSALNSRGWDFGLSISGWAGGVVTSSARWEEDARGSSLCQWEDEEARFGGCGDTSASDILEY